LLAASSQVSEAIACFEEARELQPDDRDVLHQWGNLQAQWGRYHEAIATYERAIALSPEPEASLWRDLGDAQRYLRQYRPGLVSYQRAIEQDPEDWQAWNGLSYVQAMLRQRRAALSSSDRAIDLNPEAEEVWSGRGIVLFAAGRYGPALEHFDRALVLHPDYDRAWYNRGVTLIRMGRDQEAIASLDRALELGSPADSWYVMAWLSHGFALMKLWRFQEAIASLDQVQQHQPNSYPAALYRIICVVLAGKLLNHLRSHQTRQQLGHSLKTIVQGIRYRLLILVGAIALLIFGQGAWADWLRHMIPTLFSVGIIVLIAADLWLLRDRLSFVWKTYFKSGILTYVRALGILTITITTLLVVSAYAPPPFHWGWADLVFGRPGNILFQPFNLFQTDPTSPSLEPIPESPSSLPVPEINPDPSDPSSPDQALPDSTPNETIPPVSHNAESPTVPAPPNPAQSSDIAPFITSTWSYQTLQKVFMMAFWGLLMLGIPFWARLEERIFRWGGNTWPQIAVRSTLFGLVHLIVGIPILAGFVLIVPGFLFACRYKYVFSCHFRRHGHLAQAQDAGIAASTADHAIYNAILVTFVVLTFLLL
jgi:tetratricopeptide (TPR) repeat protein